MIPAASSDSFSFPLAGGDSLTASDVRLEATATSQLALPQSSAAGISGNSLHVFVASGVADLFLF